MKRPIWPMILGIFVAVAGFGGLAVSIFMGEHTRPTGPAVQAETKTEPKEPPPPRERTSRPPSSSGSASLAKAREMVNDGRLLMNSDPETALLLCDLAADDLDEDLLHHLLDHASALQCVLDALSRLPQLRQLLFHADRLAKFGQCAEARKLYRQVAGESPAGSPLRIQALTRTDACKESNDGGMLDPPPPPAPPPPGQRELP